MAQENSNELILSSKKEILDEFHKRYPSVYLQLFSDNKDDIPDALNPYNREDER